MISPRRSAQVGYMLEKFQSVPALTEQVSAHGYTYYFVECGGKIAGYTGVKEEEDALFLSKLYLDPAFIGKGIGQKTLACVRMIAENLRLARIYLIVNKHNKRAIAAYERFGVRAHRRGRFRYRRRVCDGRLYLYLRSLKKRTPRVLTRGVCIILLFVHRLFPTGRSLRQVPTKFLPSAPRPRKPRCA